MTRSPQSPASPAPRCRSTIPTSTSAKISAPCAATSTSAARDSLSAAYTIDNGDSLIPLADPLFGSVTRLQSQVANIDETHVFSPRMLNTFRAGFSRAAFNLDPAIDGSISADSSFVKGDGPGGIVVGGGVTTTGSGTITSAGPNNAAGSWNRRNLFTTMDNFSVMRGRHQISLGVWFQRVQDNEDTASRQTGQATFTSLTTFLQGTVSSFQVVPNHTELGWRSLFGAWYVEDTIRLRPNLTLQLGLRHEFTTGWNEVAGRAANYITDSNGVLITDPRVGDSAFTKNNAKRLFGPRVGLGLGPVRQRPHRDPRRIRNLLFSDRSPQLPAERASALQRLCLLSPVRCSSFAPILPSVTLPPTCGPGVPSPCTKYAPQGVQPDAKTLTVQEWNFTVEQQLERNTALRVSYVGSFGYHGLLSIDPNTIPGADLYERRRLSGRRRCRQRRSGDRRESEPRSARRAVHPGRNPAESLPRRRLLLVHRRQQPLQRSADRREPAV